MGEYYDIAALGYLYAVRRYLTDATLRGYAFSTVAWRAMESRITAFRRGEKRRRETERRYASQTPALARDPIDELETRLIFHELVSGSTPSQRELASLRLRGYSIAETARASGMAPRRVRKLLRELFRVYLQLYN